MKEDLSKFERMSDKEYAEKIDGKLPPAAMTVMCRVSKAANGKPLFSTEFLSHKAIEGADGEVDKHSAVAVLTTIIGAAMVVSQEIAKKIGISQDAWEAMIMKSAQGLASASPEEVVAAHREGKDS